MDYFAGALELMGLWLIGSRRIAGFYCGICCNVAWIMYVIMYGKTYGLLLVVIPALAINLRNIRRWKGCSKIPHVH